MNTLFSILLLSATLSSSAASQATVSDTATVRRLLDSARVLGLPQAPLRSVVAEGTQRNEPPARIASALRTYIGALQQARTALGAKASDAEIDAGASVLLSGASVKTLDAVRAARPSANVTVALVVLADLVDRGVPVGRAEDAVVTLARVGTTDVAFKEFRASVQKDLASGQTAESSLIKRTREAVTHGRVPPDQELRVHNSPLATTRPSFGLGASISGSGAGVTGLGSAGAEMLATLGVTRSVSQSNIGVDLGTGVTGNWRERPQGLIAFGSAWWRLHSTQLRFEARTGRVPLNIDAAGIGTPFEGDPITRFNRIAYAAADTPIVSMPVSTHPATPPPDSGHTSGVNSTIATHGIAEYRMGISQRIAIGTVDASAGVRFLDQRPLDSWQSVSVATPVVPRLDVIGGFMMRRPANQLAAPAQSHLYVGLQWQVHSQADIPIAPAPADSPAATPALTGTTIMARDTTQLEVRTLGASSVEVSGDFTDWLPVAMTPVARDRWRVSLPPNAGVIHLRVRVDGGAWDVPAGIARARSAFGDDVGVVLLATHAQ